MFQKVASKNFIKSCYQKAERNLEVFKNHHNLPLTLAQKILFSHLSSPKTFQIDNPFLNLSPDRVIMQDVTAQMALLQFLLIKKHAVAVPTSIHCDHLITAKLGVTKDIQKSLINNKEVFDFLSSAASKYNIGFWKPGAGIIHQVVLENYAFPGALIIGTDSHTPNAGGLGSVAIGVGGADAVDVMAGFSWELKKPEILGVHLTGALSSWATSKDVILKLLDILTVKGGTNKIIEYFGEGANSISCTGKATITNMGAELGATSSVFPYDKKMEEYLVSTKRSSITELTNHYAKHFFADKQVLQDPHKYYDQVVEIHLSDLEPYIAGPHSPDRVRTLKQFKQEIKKEGWPNNLSSALIGSCTNSSYEDLGLAAHVAKQAHRANISMPQDFLITPGSELIKKTIERDSYMQAFTNVGAVVLANACGPCIGQWKRPLNNKKPNSILNSFNRNFKGRNDANPNTLSFIASPSIVMALGLAGRLDFNPETDDLIQGDKRITLQAPTAKELPDKDFAIDTSGYLAPKLHTEEIFIKKNSQRLQKLQAFAPCNESDFQNLIILCKAKGKCTTDHISPAGFWLKYRGHIDKISDNLLLGAVNDWTQETGRGTNIFTQKSEAFFELARDYQKRGHSWLIVGGDNYGEGSSREHAAMTPRYLGAKIVLVKSFARIHETNLKKQGVLACSFVDPKDFDAFLFEDRVSLLDLDKLQPGSQHTLIIQHKDASSTRIKIKHSFNSEQIKWFKLGSSLNTLK